jgi:ribose-phosphate pyrophosphokinase
MDSVRLFTGNSNPELAREIAAYLGIELGEARVGRFSDGEVRVEIQESVRGKDVFVVQSTCAPVNDNLMELLIMIDALKRASAGSISAVIPYYGYARQDRKAAPRAPISARLVTDMIAIAGTHRLITMELHAGQIQGFFIGPVDHLYCSPVILEYLRTLDNDRLVIVSPDAGGVERARAFAKKLNAGLAIIDKRRIEPNVAELMHIIGDVEGRDAIIVDDMVDTAGTLCEAANALHKNGARQIRAVATHPVLSGPAIKRITDSALEELIVSNTIPLTPTARECPKIRVVSAARLFGEAIKRIHDRDSVSSLFH